MSYQHEGKSLDGNKESIRKIADAFLGRDQEGLAHYRPVLGCVCL